MEDSKIDEYIKVALEVSEGVPKLAELIKELEARFSTTKTLKELKDGNDELKQDLATMARLLPLETLAVNHGTVKVITSKHIISVPIS